jgi:endonuclease G
LYKKQQLLLEFFLKHLDKTSEEAGSLGSKEMSASLRDLLPILGGRPVLKDEFNECCLIGSRDIDGRVVWSCSGILIHSQIVLTAAHCIHPGDAYVVALNTNNQNDVGNGQQINVRKVLIHPDYHKTNLYNDIATLILQSKVNTQPVSIASSQAINSTKRITLVGFGNYDPQNSAGFGTKREAEVDIMSIRHDIKEDLNNEEGRYKYESDLEFVAGGNGFDTCKGDSGGPAYIIDNEQRVVAGLTSRGINEDSGTCGDGSIYTRLDVYAPWINCIINQVGKGIIPVGC